MTVCASVVEPLLVILDMRSGGGAARILAGLREAERLRVESGREAVSLAVISPAASAPTTGADRADRALLHAAPGLLPTLQSFTVSTDERTVEFLASAHVLTPPEDTRGLPSLKPTPQAQEHISTWIKDSLRGLQLLLVCLDEPPESEWVERLCETISRTAPNHAIVFMQAWGGSFNIGPIVRHGVETAPGTGYNAELRIALHRTASISLAFGPVAAAFCDAVDDGRGYLSYSVSRSEIDRLGVDLCNFLHRRYTQGVVRETKDEVLSLDEAYNRARRLHQRGSGYVRGAVSLLQGILAKDPTHPNALAGFGHILHFYRRHSDAIDFLQRAIAIKDDDPAYFFNLGLACHAAGDFTRARVALEGAIELEPSLYEAWDMLGIVFRDLDDRDNAMRCFAEALARGPGDQKTLAAFARLLASCGEWEEAYEVARRYAVKEATARRRRECESTTIWPWRPRLYPETEGRFPAWSVPADSAR